MAVVTTRQLLESGVHFGHQTRRWNPKMKRFIFTERNGIYIIDLQQSLTYIDRAYAFVKDTVARGGQVLFVDTKKQHLAVDEARKLRIPVIGILDTNCDPDEVDFAIPGNDDAIRSVSLLTRVLADAVAEGLMARSGVQTGVEAEVEPMPDWERELLGASQEPAPAEPHDVVPVDVAPVPGEEQPEEATELAEAAADREADVEQQSDNPDPENDFNPATGSTHS